MQCAAERQAWKSAASPAIPCIPMRRSIVATGHMRIREFLRNIRCSDADEMRQPYSTCRICGTSRSASSWFFELLSQGTRVFLADWLPP